MVCTFGDTNDVVWWRELQLPIRAIIGEDGRIKAEAPDAIVSDSGREAYASLVGKTVFSAKQRVVELLRETGELDGEPRPITHAVKFYEKGDKPLEIVSTLQWYLVNGARDEALREALVARGREIAFHPEHMRVRYDNWIGGLSGDWLVSRQRFFGVPIPVWYRLGADGERTGEVLVPDEAQLPVDPSSDAPAGFEASQRGVPGGFVGEVDIMDTWATSSLTPQIAGGWGTDDELFDLVFPYQLRSQGQDIIRTWLFSTTLRAHLEHGSIPWTNAGISGFIVDPDRKKMSKSKGNVVTPAAMLDDHGSDAVRYWAASSKLGIDAPFDPQNPTVIKIGRRLAIKVLNAAKFVYGFPFAEGAEPSTPLDRSLLGSLRDVVARATAAFDGYDHQQALEATETLFWTFCDDYLELVKERAYSDTGGRAGERGRDAPARDRRVPQAARAVHPVRDRGGVVVDARGLGPHRRLADRRRAPDRRPRRPRGRVGRAHRHPRREDAGEALAEGRRRLGDDRGACRARGGARRPQGRRPDPECDLRARRRRRRLRRRAHRHAGRVMPGALMPGPRVVEADEGGLLMELGTRWDVGDEPPSDLPDEVLRAIDRVEAELETDGVDVVGWRWTLTWLERRPRVEPRRRDDDPGRPGRLGDHRRTSRRGLNAVRRLRDAAAEEARPPRRPELGSRRRGRGAGPSSRRRPARAPLTARSTS